MKSKHQIIQWLALLALATINHQLSTAHAQGTAFTYQGRLNNTGNPANGLYDIRAGLYASGSGGALISALYTNSAVPVSNGLFTITLDFGSLFDGTPYWLQIGVRTNGGGASFTPLSPRQELTPTPYAIFAEGANAAGLSGTVPLAQLPGVVLTNNEPSVTLSNVTVSGNLSLPLPANIAAGGSSFFLADNNGNFFAGPGAGNLTLTGGLNTGVGLSALFGDTTGSHNTAEGAGALQLNTTGSYNAGFGLNALFYNTTGSYNTANGAFALLYNTTASNNTANGAFALSAYFMPNYLTAGGNTADGAYALFSDETGYNNTAVGYQALYSLTAGYDNVGIGVDAFQVNTGYQNTAVGTYAFQHTTNGNGNIGLGYGAGANLAAGNNNIYIGNEGHTAESGITRIGLNGTQTATYLAGSATVEGEYLVVNGLTPAYCYLGDDGSGRDVQIGSQKPGVTAVSCYNSADKAYMHLYCSSITIKGGSDLAEPFKISSGNGEVPEGSVVVIDEQNPGHLKMSDQGYDTHVAGVISGANGINPGIQMQQQGLLEGGKNVALTGRVYVQADSSNGAIKPGDLLTTSTIPGHAMKVTDHAKAAGAVLGKAMTGLSEGQGMVLVLVTLQ